MEEVKNQPEARDVQCVSDGKRMFLKLGATALAALALDGLTAKLAAANDNRILNLPMAPQSGAVDLGAGDVGIMNYAFALEQAELAFLKQVLARPFAELPLTSGEFFRNCTTRKRFITNFSKRCSAAARFPRCKPIFQKSISKSATAF